MISNKIALIAYIICIFISATLWFYFSLVKKIAVIEFRIYSCIFLFLSLIFSRKYTFVNNPKAIHFWQISLAFSIFVTVVVAVLLIKNKIVLKDNRVSEKVAAIFLAFIISFCFAFPIPSHLNYLLDFEEPKEEFWAEIEEKDKNIRVRRRRVSTDYYFYFNIDGKEVKMDVSESEYSFYEEGDHYPIKVYSGAFDDPFYFSGNIKD